MTSLTPEQAAAKAMFKKHPVSIVTGGPGYGKTTLLGELLGKDVVLCGPTGAAAERLIKQTGEEAHVIDAILYNKELIKQFKNCKLIIDECSMVSIELAAKILHTLQPKKVLFIGDPNQLAPVNSVSILSTILGIPEIPRVTLTVNLRQESIHSALYVNLRDMKMSYEDLSFKVHRVNHMQIVDTVVALFKIEPSQIIALTNATCKILNEATTNQNAKLIGKGFRVGDSVQCKVNKYGQVKGKKKLLVANGSMGFMQANGSVDYNNGFVDKRTRDKYGNETWSTTFDHSRCITIYNSQGSEFASAVILVLDKIREDFDFSQLYTAISRARFKVHIVGVHQTIQKAFASTYQPEIDPLVTESFNDERIRLLHKTSSSH